MTIFDVDAELMEAKNLFMPNDDETVEEAVNNQIMTDVALWKGDINTIVLHKSDFQYKNGYM